MSNDNIASGFNVNASLIKRLAEEIVPNHISALVELLKNAYDADADEVTIEINTRQAFASADSHFNSPEVGFIKITDNGTGMSRAELSESWLNLSFSSKGTLKAETTTEKKRSPMGGQGMGRLGTFRLGRYVELFSSRGENELHHLAFDWNEFNGEKKVTEVNTFIESIQRPTPNGTQILIFPLQNGTELQGQNGRELIQQLRDRVRFFTDRKSFRVHMHLDDEKTELGKNAILPTSTDQVYLQPVWQKMTPTLVQEVLAFWDSNKMIREGISSEERAQQVVILVRDKSTDKIVGLSTAGLVIFKQLNDNRFYLYRTIVLPEFRQPGLASKVIVETRTILEDYSQGPNTHGCIGMLAFVESPQLQQHRREAIWRASKMAFIGVDKKGRHIRVYYFKGTTI